MSLCIFVSYLTLTMIVVASNNYHINDGAIPSYLYRKFDNLNEDTFPMDIKINISLSRISGTLLYSIDKNMHQLIVSLHDSVTPTLGIELNKQQHFVSLSELCGCEKCRYEIFNLRVQINSFINIQCNGGIVQRFKKSKIRSLNLDYPIPYTNTTSTITSHNEAHLWLLNTPQYNNLYPNNNQLSGCIFNVWYEGRSIIFTNITSNIERKCVRKCIDDVCNGGHCYETYNSVPYCNCTSTMMNGPFCNDALKTMNLQSLSQYFIFDMFKLSWSSSVNEIFLLKNENVQIRMSHMGTDLFFHIESYNATYTRITLMKEYLTDKKYICVVYFYDKFIEIMTFSKDKWKQTIVPINLDLRKETFHTLTLRSGVGTIDMAFKSTPNEYVWKRVNIKSYILIAQEVPHRMSNDSSDSNNNISHTESSNIKDDISPLIKDSNNAWKIGFGIVSTVLIIALGFIAYTRIIIFKRNRKLNSPYNEANTSLIASTTRFGTQVVNEMERNTTDENKDEFITTRGQN